MERFVIGDQGHIRAAANVAQENVRDAMTQIEADAYAAAKANGMTVVELTDQELKRGRRSQPVYDSISKRLVIWAKRFRRGEPIISFQMRPSKGRVTFGDDHAID